MNLNNLDFLNFFHLNSRIYANFENQCTFNLWSLRVSSLLFGRSTSSPSSATSGPAELLALPEAVLQDEALCAPKLYVLFQTFHSLPEDSTIHLQKVANIMACGPLSCGSSQCCVLAQTFARLRARRPLARYDGGQGSHWRDRTPRQTGRDQRSGAQKRSWRLLRDAVLALSAVVLPAAAAPQADNTSWQGHWRYCHWHVFVLL